MSNKKTRLDKDTIHFLSEVDHALNSRGKSIVYLISFVSLFMIVGFIVWAKYAVLDEVTRGMGRVIPAQRTQEIANLEGGILKDVYVVEGQIVKVGDVLCRLQNEQAASTFRDAFSQSLDHKASIARLKGEINGDIPVFDEELQNKAPQLVNDQLRLYNTNFQGLAIELDVLRAQYEQKQHEVAEMKSRMRQLQKSVGVAKRQRNIAKPLVAKQIHSELDFLALEQKVLEIAGDLESIKSSIPKAESAAREALSKIEQRKNSYRSEALVEVTERRQKLLSIQEALSAGNDRVTRTDVRSPVRGIVKHILVNTLGGVVQPGQSIMEIVPLDDTLLVEAEVKPSDIAFLHPKQKTMVKITAYDFSIYGGLEGTIENISADTIEDEKGESFYVIKVRTTENSMKYRGEELPIIPGMTAQVDILTGKKSVLDYLLKPILKAKQNALRER